MANNHTTALFFERLNTLLTDSDELLRFLFMMSRCLQMTVPINPEWRTAQEVNYSGNTLVSGPDGCHKGVLIVAGHEKEIAFSDMHGDYRTFFNMLDDLLVHLNQDGVVIAHGDLISKINSEQRHDYSFLLFIALMLLKNIYPSQFFYLLGNHELDDCKDYLNNRHYSMKKEFESYPEQYRALLGNLIYEQIVPNLPEIVLSKVTNSVYVHAALPLFKLKTNFLSDLFLTDNIVAQRDTLLIQSGQRFTTHAVGFFDDSTEYLNKLMGSKPDEPFVKVVVGHSHYPFLGVKTLNETGWFYLQKDSLMTTHTSAELIAPKVTCLLTEVGKVVGDKAFDVLKETETQIELKLKPVSIPVMGLVTTEEMHLNLIARNPQSDFESILSEQQAAFQISVTREIDCLFAAYNNLKIKKISKGQDALTLSGWRKMLVDALNRLPVNELVLEKLHFWQQEPLTLPPKNFFKRDSMETNPKKILLTLIQSAQVGASGSVPLFRDVDSNMTLPPKVNTRRFSD